MPGEVCLRRRAATLFRTGLRAKGLGANDSEAAWLRFGLVRALHRVPEPENLPAHEDDEGFRALVAAYEYFEAPGDTRSAVRVAEYPLVCGQEGAGKIRAPYDRAVSLVQEDSPE